jgi:uncharacterized protein (TIGR02145 family)
MKKLSVLLAAVVFGLGLPTVFYSCEKNDANGNSPNNGGSTSAIISGNGWVLINGVKWATRNVNTPGTFADRPESAGMFYQWNCKVGWSTSELLYNSNNGTIWDRLETEEWYEERGNCAQWKRENDPSPVGFRVPTGEELQSLLNSDKVTSEWITIGTKGRRFTDKQNGNTIFLPAPGFRDSYIGKLYSTDISGWYWSVEKSLENEGEAYALQIHKNSVLWIEGRAGHAFSVRPVVE